MNELRLNAHKYNDIEYQSVTLHTELIGWRYILPKNNDKIVLMQSLMPKIEFVITNWDNFMDKIQDDSLSQILIFKEDTSNKDIFDCIKNYIKCIIRAFIETIDNSENDKMKHIIHKLDQKYTFSEEDINYEKIISFNFDNKKIENVV